MTDGERLDALTEGLESDFWKALTEEILGRIARATLALRAESSTKTLDAVRIHQAEIAVLDALLKWPGSEVRRIRANFGRTAVSVPSE